MEDKNAKAAGEESVMPRSSCRMSPSKMLPTVPPDRLHKYTFYFIYIYISIPMRHVYLNMSLLCGFSLQREFVSLSAPG